LEWYNEYNVHFRNFNISNQKTCTIWAQIKIRFKRGTYGLVSFLKIFTIGVFIIHRYRTEDILKNLDFLYKELRIATRHKKLSN